MSFDEKKWKILSTGQYSTDPRTWGYDSDENIDSIAASGYFNDVYLKIRKNDLIYISASDRTDFFIVISDTEALPVEIKSTSETLVKKSDSSTAIFQLRNLTSIPNSGDVDIEFFEVYNNSEISGVTLNPNNTTFEFSDSVNNYQIIYNAYIGRNFASTGFSDVLFNLTVGIVVLTGSEMYFTKKDSNINNPQAYSNTQILFAQNIPQVILKGSASTNAWELTQCKIFFTKLPILS